jgi:hypothetical protein
LAEVTLWHNLQEDPLYELRVYAANTRRREPVPGKRSAGERLKARIKDFSMPKKARDLLEQVGLVDLWIVAFQEILSDPLTVAAVNATDPVEGRTEAAIARAATALASLYGLDDGLPMLTAESRDTVVLETTKALAESMPGGTLGVLTPFRKFASHVALKVATRRVADRRRSLTDHAFPVAGDILVYQARGARLQGFIQDAINSVQEPVIVLAHSLGGIGCIDLLVKQHIPNVQCLITVGSQAPFFYEIGALQSLAYPDSLPDHFPRWLNIYDPDDFLSYIGNAIFPDKIQDFRVSSGQPFPASHSAYWTNPEVWKQITAFANGS